MRTRITHNYLVIDRDNLSDQVNILNVLAEWDRRKKPYQVVNDIDPLGGHIYIKLLASPAERENLLSSALDYLETEQGKISTNP